MKSKAWLPPLRVTASIPRKSSSSPSEWLKKTVSRCDPRSDCIDGVKVKSICAKPADDHVAAAASEKQVVAKPAFEPVVSEPTAQIVVIVFAEKQIVSVASVEPVVAGAPEKLVVAQTAKKDIVAGTIMATVVWPILLTSRFPAVSYSSVASWAVTVPISSLAVRIGLMAAPATIVCRR